MFTIFLRDASGAETRLDPMDKTAVEELEEKIRRPIDLDGRRRLIVAGAVGSSTSILADQIVSVRMYVD